MKNIISITSGRFTPLTFTLGIMSGPLEGITVALSVSPKFVQKLSEDLPYPTLYINIDRTSFSCEGARLETPRDRVLKGNSLALSVNGTNTKQQLFQLCLVDPGVGNDDLHGIGITLAKEVELVDSEPKAPSRNK